MFGRKKGFTAKQTKRTTRRMNESTIGSHVQRTPRGGHASPNASSVSFSSARASKRASNGEVGTLLPSTASGEDQAAYRQRVQQRRYIEELQHRARVRRVIVIVIIAIVVIGLAVGAGLLAYRGTVGSGMALRNSDAGAALSAPEEGKGHFTLIACDLGAAAVPLEQDGPDAIILAYVDAPRKALSLISLPNGLQVYGSDGETHRLADIASQGDAAFIEAVEKYANIDVSHYVKMDAADLAGMVDELGGVEVSVNQIIDDPHAGDVYLPVGDHTLNGRTALVYLRADNLKLGIADQLANQTDFAARLVAKLFEPEGTMAFTSRLESITPFIQTDYSLADLTEMESWLSSVPEESIKRIVLPGYTTAISGVVDSEQSYYVTSSSSMSEIIEAVEEGREPSVGAGANAADVVPSEFTIEVQNGTNITGAAGVTEELLESAGFVVKKTGNAEVPIYDETLVVYQGDNGQARAQAVINALGVGRAVDAGYYYDFDDDILVIIGSDFKPVS